MSAPVHVRAFAGISLSAEVRERIVAKQDQLAREWGPPLVRWTDADAIHLTLRFLGNVETARLPALQDALREAGRGLAPIGLSARGMGCFPSCQRPSVIWVGLEGGLEALGALQAKVERACAPFAAHTEDRAFHPHLTIGRVKMGGAKSRQLGERVQSESSSDFGSWEADRFKLIQSQLSPRGSIYTTLSEVVLALG